MFKSEYELQQCFFEQLVQNKKTNNHILQEFNARFGNVDIVDVSFNYSHFVNNYNNNQLELLSIYSNALVVGLLHKHSFRTYKYLLTKTGYSKEYLNSILYNLQKEKIIYTPITNKYAICEDFKFPNLKFTSYELKLKDWKKAILQATRNKTFSYCSYVVMPNDEALKIKSKYFDVFKLYNVGLIGVTKSTNYSYFSPKIQMPSLSSNPLFISSIAKYLCQS